jgi:predicted DnaQ family exonuclease/DinG family helicase
MDISEKILSELHLSEFVALDIETTGLEYQKDDIIEFGAVRYVNGNPSQTISFLIKPSRLIPENIQRITGISDKDVAHSPKLEEKAEEILSFVGSSPIVAHNIFFDLPFLEYHLQKVNNVLQTTEKNVDFVYLSNDKFDTLSLAKIYLPFQNGFSLTKLAEYFGIVQETAHRALPDAQTAGQIFMNLVEMSLHTDFKNVQQILKILDPTDDPLKSYFFRLQAMLSTGKYHFPKRFEKSTFEYSANYYNIIGEEDTPENGHLSTEVINGAEIASFFDKDGDLEKSFGVYEQRPSQVKMADAVARAFNSQNFLVVEAGTGTGKSMAYLLPAIKWAIQNYGPFGRVVISTNTKNLQEQLFFKDIPILHNILNEKFKVVLLKGKNNYLCLDKWFTVLKDMKYRLSSYERSKVLPLLLWVKQTETGDISENNAFAPERNMGIWSKFIAENNYCPGKSCKYYNNCFLWRARNNAKNAHLVLVNHSLLFSDIASDQAVISEYSNLILDEAHNIEKVATEYLGMEISLWNFRDTFQKLYQRERIETGILVQLRRRIQTGEMDGSKKDLLQANIKSLTSLVTTCWITTQGFFKELNIQLKNMVGEISATSYSTRYRYKKDDGLLGKMESYFAELMDYLSKLQSDINDLIELLRELPDDAFRYQKQLYQELQAQFTQLDGLTNNLQFLIAAEWDNWVYWFELPGREDSDYSRLYGAPLNISEILNERLYKHLNTAIFTSATLAVGKSFDYFLSRIGLNLLEPDRLESLLLESPFNYDEQVFLAIPTFLPDPRSPEYRNAIKSFLEMLSREQPRGTLVLFTSYMMMNELYDSLRLTYESRKISLLTQGIHGSRHSILSQFKEHPQSVLFGTDSFWEGIDLPGKELEILLITKLPFDVPTEPIIQAKAEMIQKAGGNPFLEFTVPEAVIKFRQGFGRLIRSRSDYGAVIILDNRLVTKMYGRMFLDSIPAKSRLFKKDEELWEELLRWFH